MNDNILKKDRIKIKISTTNGYVDILARVVKINNRLFAIHNYWISNKKTSAWRLALTEFTTGKMIDDFVVNKNLPTIGLMVRTIVQIERTNNLDEVIKQFPSVNKLTDKTEKKVYDLGNWKIKNNELTLEKNIIGKSYEINL